MKRDNILNFAMLLFAVFGVLLQTQMAQAQCGPGAVSYSASITEICFDDACGGGDGIVGAGFDYDMTYTFSGTDCNGNAINVQYTDVTVAEGSGNLTCAGVPPVSLGAGCAPTNTGSVTITAWEDDCATGSDTSFESDVLSCLGNADDADVGDAAAPEMWTYNYDATATGMGGDYTSVDPNGAPCFGFVVESECLELCAGSCQAVDAEGCPNLYFEDDLTAPLPGSTSVGAGDGTQVGCIPGIDAVNGLEVQGVISFCFDFTPQTEDAVQFTNFTLAANPACIVQTVSIFDANCEDVAVSQPDVVVFQPGAFAGAADNLIAGTEYKACIELDFSGCTAGVDNILFEFCPEVIETGCSEAEAGSLELDQQFVCAGETFTIDVLGDIVFPENTEDFGTGSDNDQTTGSYFISAYYGTTPGPNPVEDLFGIGAAVPDDVAFEFFPGGDLTYDYFNEAPFSNGAGSFGGINVSGNHDVAFFPFPTNVPITLVGIPLDELTQPGLGFFDGTLDCNDFTNSVTFTLLEPLAYDATETYQCISDLGFPINANDDDEYVLVTLGNFAGGQNGADGSALFACGATNLYVAGSDLDGNGAPDPVDADGDGIPDQVDVTSGNFIFPASGAQFFTLSNQPWSLTVCDNAGCEITATGSYNFPEPEIFMPSFACSTQEDPLTLIGDPDFNYSTTPALFGLYTADLNLYDPTTFTLFETVAVGSGASGATGVLTDTGTNDGVNGLLITATFDPAAAWNSIIAAGLSTSGQLAIDLVISDPATGCTQLATQMISIAECTPPAECADAQDLNIDDKILCPGDVLNIDVVVEGDVIMPDIGCNANGVCEAANGESSATCPGDCPDAAVAPGSDADADGNTDAGYWGGFGPYSFSDPCYLAIVADDFVCGLGWDAICDDAYNFGTNVFTGTTFPNCPDAGAVVAAPADGLGAYGVFVADSDGYDPYTDTGGTLLGAAVIPGIDITNPVIPQVPVTNNSLSTILPSNTLLFAIGSVWDDQNGNPVAVDGCQDLTSAQPFVIFDDIEAVGGHCQCLNDGTDGTDGQFLVNIDIGSGGAATAASGVPVICNGVQTGIIPPSPELLQFLADHGLDSGNFSYSIIGGVNDLTEETSGTIAQQSTLSVRVTDGQVWSVTITDDAGCSITVGGVCDEPDPDFTGLQSIYCVDDPPNPLFDEQLFEVGFQAETDCAPDLSNQTATSSATTADLATGNIDPFFAEDGYFVTIPIPDPTTNPAFDPAPPSNCTVDDIVIDLAYTFTDLTGVGGDFVIFNPTATSATPGACPAAPIGLQAVPGSGDAQVQLDFAALDAFCGAGLSDLVPGNTLDVWIQAFDFFQVPDVNYTVTDFCATVSVAWGCEGGINPDDLLGEYYFDGLPVTGGVPGLDPLVDNGDGTATLDPFWAGPGQHLVSYCIEYGHVGANNGSPGYINDEDPDCIADNCSQECRDNCVVCADQVFSIYPVFDPAFFLPTTVCVDYTGDFNLQLDDRDNIFALWTALEPTFDPDNTVDEEDFFIQWTGYGVTDLNDGGDQGPPGVPDSDGSGNGTFNVAQAIADYNAAAAADGEELIEVNGAGEPTNPDQFPLCISVRVDLGYPTCEQFTEHDICIVFNPDATIDDRTVCAGSNGQYDLSALFGIPTTQEGGVFSSASLPAGVTIVGDVLSYDPNTITDPLTVTITYSFADGTLTNGSDCSATDDAVLTIIPVPSDDLDLPSYICDNEDLNVADYLVDSEGNPSTMTGTYSIVTSGAPTGGDSIDPTTGVYTPEDITGSTTYLVTIQFEGENTANGVTCTVIDQEVIEVKDGGDPTWSFTGPICASEGPWNILDSVTGDQTGMFMGPFVVWADTDGDDVGDTWQLDPGILVDQSVNIQYCVGAEECQSCQKITIEIDPCSSAELADVMPEYCLDGLVELGCIDLDKYLAPGTDESGFFAVVHNNMNGLESGAICDDQGTVVLDLGGDDVDLAGIALQGTELCMDDLHALIVSDPATYLPLTDPTNGTLFAEFTVFYIQPESGVCKKFDTFTFIVKDAESCSFELPNVICEESFEDGMDLNGDGQGDVEGTLINLNSLVDCQCDPITVNAKATATFDGVNTDGPFQIGVSFPDIPDGSALLEVQISYDYIGTVPDAEGDHNGYAISGPTFDAAQQATATLMGTSFGTLEAVNGDEALGEDGDNHFGQVCDWLNANGVVSTATGATYPAGSQPSEGDSSYVLVYNVNPDTDAGEQSIDLIDADALTNGCLGNPFTYAVYSNSSHWEMNLFVSVTYSPCRFGPLTLHEVASHGGTVPADIQAALDQHFIFDAETATYYLDTEGLGEYDELEIGFEKLSCNGCNAETGAVFVMLEQYDATLMCDGPLCISSFDPVYLPEAFFMDGVTTPGGIWVVPDGSTDGLSDVTGGGIIGDYFYPDRVDADSTYTVCYVMQEGVGDGACGAGMSCCQITVPAKCNLRFEEETVCEDCEEGAGVKILADCDFGDLGTSIQGSGCRTSENGIQVPPGDVNGGPSKPTSEDDPNAATLCSDFFTVITATVTGLPVNTTIDSVTFQYNYYSTLGTAQGDHDGWGIYDADPATLAGCDGNIPAGYVIGFPDGQDTINGDNHFPEAFPNAAFTEATVTAADNATFIANLQAALGAGCDSEVMFSYIIASNSQYWDACFNVIVHYSGGESALTAVLHENGTPIADLLGYDPIFLGADGSYYINTCELGQFDEIDVVFGNPCAEAGECAIKFTTENPLVVLEEESAPIISGLPGVVCAGDGTLTGFIGSPSGGTWDVAVNGTGTATIDATTGLAYTATVPGDVITVTYTGPDSNTSICGEDNNTVTWLITVIDPEEDFAPVISGDAVACVGETVTLTALPDGGDWGGAFSTSTGNEATVTSATIGDVVVTYTVRVDGNCGPSAATASFTVSFIDTDPIAPVITGIPAVYCAGGTDVYPLDDTHVEPNGLGGAWTVNGSAATDYTPSTTPGDVDVITYTATVADVCTDGTVEVTVDWLVTILDDTAPSANISGVPGFVCLDDAAATYTAVGTPAGGTYTVDNGSIDASTGELTTAGIGTYTITYTVSDAATCSGTTDLTATWTLVITDSTPSTAEISGLNDLFCVGADAVTLGDEYGNPDGGSWFVDGTAATEFDPAATGTYTVMYVVGIDDVCAGGTVNDTVKQVITVIESTPPSANISGLAATYCAGDSETITLVGTPAGGVFTLDGDTITEFVAGTPGSYEITYTVMVNDPCNGETEATTTSITTVIDDGFGTIGNGYVCQSEDDYTIDLTQYLPDGAPGVDNGGNFTLADLKPFFTEFEYTDDCNEFLEIAGPAGYDLTGWSIHFYGRTNWDMEDGTPTDHIGGTSGTVYNIYNIPDGTTIDQDITAASNGESYAVVAFDLDGTLNDGGDKPANGDPIYDIADDGNEPYCWNDFLAGGDFYYTYNANGTFKDSIYIAGGAVALVSPDGDVVQFVGYGQDGNTNWGIFSACDGPAAGLVSTDVNDIDQGHGTLQFTNYCWTFVPETGADDSKVTDAFLCNDGSCNEFNTDMDPANAGSIVNAFYFDHIAPSGDELNLANFCWSLFIGGSEVDGPGTTGWSLGGGSTEIDLTKNQVYELCFDYATESDLCGVNEATFCLTIFEDYEEWWTAPDAVCENADPINLTAAIEDSVHFIPPYCKADVFTACIDTTFEEARGPAITEIHGDDYGFEGFSSDDHCIGWNFVENPNATLTIEDDKYVTDYFCEGVEISAPEGTDLACFALIFYAPDSLNAGTQANGLMTNVVYIGEDGLPTETNVVNGEYVQLYGTIDDDEGGSTNPNGYDILTVPAFELDFNNNLPYYDGIDPTNENFYGNAPADPGLYLDVDGDGVYGPGDTKVEASDFPWEREDNCTWRAADRNEDVGSRWFPILDIPDGVAGVGLINICTGEKLEFLSWGDAEPATEGTDAFCVHPDEDFSLAGPFAQCISTVIDTAQNLNADQGDLRTLQLMSCAELGLDGDDCDVCAEADAAVWAIVYAGGNSGAGTGGGVAIPQCDGLEIDDLDYVGFSNSIGFYNCELDPEYLLPSPEAFSLDLSDADMPDDAIITGHTVIVTIDTDGEEAVFQYTIGSEEGVFGPNCGDFHEETNTNIGPGEAGYIDGCAEDSNACYDGQFDSGDDDGVASTPDAPLVILLGSDTDASLSDCSKLYADSEIYDDSGNLDCYIGKCTKEAKDVYYVSDLIGYIFNTEEPDVVAPDSCKVCFGDPDTYDVSIEVIIEYEQAYPIGAFSGFGVSLNEDDPDNPYWQFNPNPQTADENDPDNDPNIGLSDYSPVEVTYDVNNANVLTPDPTDDLDCLDDDNGIAIVRTQLIPVVSAHDAEWAIEELSFCLGDAGVDLDQYLGGGIDLGGHYSGNGVGGAYFDPAAAGVGTHDVVYALVGSGLCADYDTLSVTVNDEGLSPEWDWNDDISGSGEPTLCSGSGVSSIDEIATFASPIVNSTSLDNDAVCVGGSLNSNADDFLVELDTAKVNIPEIPCGGEVVSVTVKMSYENTDSGFGDADSWTLVGPDGSTMASGTNDNVVDSTIVYTDYTWTDHTGATTTGADQASGDWMFIVESNSFPWEACLEIDVVYVQAQLSGLGIEYYGDGNYGFNADGLQGHGNFTITYGVGCDVECGSGSVSNDIYVLAGTNEEIALGEVPSEICDSDASITLSATPAGGTWSGPGVGGDAFNPAGLSDTITLTYTIGDGSITCSSSASVSLVVNKGPEFFPPSSACGDDAPFDLGATVAAGSEGGTWSASAGTISEDGIFDPGDASGAITITYTLNGCSATEVMSVGGGASPTWTTEDGFFTYCENQLPVELVKPDGSPWTDEDLGEWVTWVDSDGVDSLITITPASIGSMDTTFECTVYDTLVTVLNGDTLSTEIVCSDSTMVITDNTSNEYTVMFNADLANYDHVAYTVTHYVGGVACREEQTSTINVYAKPHEPVISYSEDTVCLGDVAEIVEISTYFPGPFPNHTFHVFDANGELIQGGNLDSLTFNNDIFDPNPFIDTEIDDTTYVFYITEVNFEVWHEVCDSDPVTLTIYVAPVPEFEYQVGCTDAATNAAALLFTSIGGLSPYDISINGGGFFAFNPDPETQDSTLNVLVPGVNDVLIRDANGCEYKEVIFVEDVVGFTHTVTCPDEDGNVTLTLSPNGGNDDGDYTVSINGGDTYGEPGDYTFSIPSDGGTTLDVRVRDDAGCESAITPVDLFEPISFSVEAGCPDADGLVTVIITPADDRAYDVTVNGSPADLTFTAQPGATLNIVLQSGDCTASDVFTVGSAPTVSVSQDCPIFDTADGSSSTMVHFDVSGGAGDYTIAVNGSNLPAGATSTSLPAGSYSVTVTDENGCVASTTFEINDMLQITLLKESSTLLVCGEGDIAIVVDGPTPETTYDWYLDPAGTIPASGTASGNTFTNSDVFGAGVFYVIGTTENGCVTEPLGISAYHFSAFTTSCEATCNDDGTYTVTCAIEGGRPDTFADVPYTANGEAIDGTTYSVTLSNDETFTVVFDDGGSSGGPSCDPITEIYETPCAAECNPDAGTLASLGTDFYCASSTVSVNTVGAASGYELVYLVTSGTTVVAVSDDGDFNGLGDSSAPTSYEVWALSYRAGDATIPSVGGDVSELDGCFDLSSSESFTVLTPIMINATAECNTDIGGNVIMLTITGGRPEFDSFGSYLINFPNLDNDGQPSVLNPDGNGGTGTIVDSNNEPFEVGDTVTVSVSSDGALCQGGPVTVIIEDACSALVANDDEAGSDGNAITFNVMDNDLGAVRVTSATEPSNGTLTWNEDGTFTYTPDDGFEGTEVIIYQVVNASGNTATATLTIVVNGGADDHLDVAHNRICNDDTGDAELVIAISGDAPPFTIDGGDFRETLDAGGSVTFPLSGEATSYSFTVTDANGDQVSVNETDLTPCTKVATELVDFSGEVVAAGNAIKWITASEFNNDYFTLEHSVDGVNFTTITVMKGAGTTTDAQVYNYLHKEAVAGVNYYRLSDTDFDGNTTTHRTITLVRGEADFGFINIYPVPVSHVLNVDFAAATEGDVDIQVYNVAGKMVSTQRVSSIEGVNSTTVDVRNFPTGTYYINIVSEGTVRTQKFVKH